MFQKLLKKDSTWLKYVKSKDIIKQVLSHKDIIQTDARSGGDFADNFPIFTDDHETYRFYTRSTEYHHGTFQKYMPNATGL